MTFEDTLHQLESVLYGYNYAVFLHRYQLPFSSTTTIEDYIAQVLPHAEVGGMQTVSSEAVLIEIEQALRYAGDAGSGPKATVLDSPQFEELLGAVLSHLKHVLSDATIITNFWLKQGHPAYPVFWDFAFVIVGTQQVEIFIGSSSD
jgi:hypothetical protein